MFQLQRTSNYGTSTPAVARTVPQGVEILDFFNTAEAQKEACKLVLMELQRHLVRCVEINQRITAEIEAGLKSVTERDFDFSPHKTAISLPGVADLHSQAEAFLQSAKLAIRETARLAEPFYGGKHDHRFHKFASWAAEKFGAGDKFTQTVRAWEPWVKAIVTMRNAVDHPEDKPGRKLITHNFRLANNRESRTLVEPTWGLLEVSEWFIRADMESIIEGTIKLGEDLIASLFYKLKVDFPIVIYEIPEEQRDPSFPRRLRIGLASEPKGV